MSDGRLTTHVLDTARGVPAAGIVIELWALDGDERRLLTRTRTNAQGRSDSPLLDGADLTKGVYELLFMAGDYFVASGQQLPDPPFLDEVVIDFGVAADGGHYHVPLLVSPYGYSTYRGS